MYSFDSESPELIERTPKNEPHTIPVLNLSRETRRLTRGCDRVSCSRATKSSLVPRIVVMTGDREGATHRSGRMPVTLTDVGVVRLGEPGVRQRGPERES